MENELGKKIVCDVDEATLSASHRNNQLICDYSAKLYPGFSVPKACECESCRRIEDHKGVFIIKPSQVSEYLKLYNPVQLRWSSASNTNPSYEVHNFGESKGITKDRVLIYPTRTMKDWIKDNSYNLKNEVRAKFYVGLTRSRLSSSIVMDYADDEQFDGVTPLPEVLR